AGRGARLALAAPGALALADQVAELRMLGAQPRGERAQLLGREGRDRGMMARRDEGEAVMAEQGALLALGGGHAAILLPAPCTRRAPCAMPGRPAPVPGIR